MGPQSKYLDHAWGDPLQLGGYVCLCGHGRGHELNYSLTRVLQNITAQSIRGQEKKGAVTMLDLLLLLSPFSLEL